MFPSFDFSGFPLSLEQPLGWAGDLTEQPQTLAMEIPIQGITVQENPGEYNLF